MADARSRCRTSPYSGCKMRAPGMGCSVLRAKNRTNAGGGHKIGSSSAFAPSARGVRGMADAEMSYFRDYRPRLRPAFCVESFKRVVRVFPCVAVPDGCRLHLVADHCSRADHSKKGQTRSV